MQEVRRQEGNGYVEIDIPETDDLKREKVRRQDKKDVDIAVVEELKRYQKGINNRLKGSVARCTLHPKPDLEPCKSCRKYHICKRSKKERAYILSDTTSYNSSKRRKRQNEKSVTQSSVMDSHEVKEKVYPCEPFDFGCPDKDFCDEGRNCPWKD